MEYFQKQIFRRTISTFIIIGIVFWLAFTLLFIFLGAPILERFGSGYKFILLLIVTFLLVTLIFALSMSLTKTSRNFAPIAAVGLSLPGMLLDSVVLQYIDKFIGELVGMSNTYGAILLLAYGSIFAVSLVYFKE